MSEVVIGEAHLKHYVVWHGQGGSVSACEEIESRDASTVRYKANTNCFLIYDRVVFTCTVAGKVVAARSEGFNFSPRYVPGGRIVTGEERDALFAPGGSLDGYMNPDRWEVVATAYRNDMVVSPGSCVLLPLAETVG